MTDLPQAYHGHPYDADHVKARAAFDHDKGQVVVEAEFTTQYFVLDPYVMPMTYKGALQLEDLPREVLAGLLRSVEQLK